MRLINKTEWRTDDLRRFSMAGLKANGMDHRGYVVEFRYQRENSCLLGLGWVGKKKISLRLRRPEGEWKNEIDPRVVKGMTSTFDHEIAHNRGVDHSDMGHCGGDWADGIRIRKKEPKVRNPDELAAKRETHVRKMLVKAERRFKMSKTILQKWKKKAKYYDRKAAARRGRE